MNDTAGGSGDRPPRRPEPRRAGMLAAALAGIAVLPVACGSSGSPGAATSKTYQKALAFAQCMRSHGAPGFPGPSSAGTFDIPQTEANSPLMTSAANACRKLIPPGAVQQSAAQQRAVVSQALKQSACMRSRGYPNFPDPVFGPNGSISWPVGPPMGIDPKSAQFQAAQQTCQKLGPIPGFGDGS